VPSAGDGELAEAELVYAIIQAGDQNVPDKHCRTSREKPDSNHIRRPKKAAKVNKAP
jgi:hypothetical protein